MGDTTDSTNGTTDPLYVRTRCQLNFIENVPFALLISLLAELNGANRYAFRIFKISHPSPSLLSCRPESSSQRSSDGLCKVSKA